MQSRLTIKLILCAIIMVFPVNTRAAIKGYIPNSADNTVSVINIADNSVSTITPVGNSPFGVAVSPTGDFIYITNQTLATVDKIDRQTAASVESYNVHSTSAGVAVSPDGTEVYVANQDGYLSVINTTASSVTDYEISTSLFGVAVSPDGESIYLTDDTANLLYIVRHSDMVKTASLTVGLAPKGIAANPFGTNIVVANSGDNTVSVITVATNLVGLPLTVGATPFGVAISPDGLFAYVTNTGDSTVSRIALSTSLVDAPLKINPDIADVAQPEDGPKGIDISPWGDKVYVVNNTPSPGTVKVINTADFSLDTTTTLTVGNSPVGFGKFFFPITPTNLTATLVGQNGIDLTWDDNTDTETSYILERRKYTKGSFAVIASLPADTTSYSDSNLDMYSNFYYRVKAYNSTTSSPYSNIAFAQTLREDTGGCFIATAAYGSYWEPQVMILRDFRDSFLLTNRAGKLFVNTYYRFSPPAADFIARHDVLRFITRISLVPLIGFSWLTLQYGIAISLSLVAALIMALFLTGRLLVVHTRRVI